MKNLYIVSFYFLHLELDFPFELFQELKESWFADTFH